MYARILILVCSLLLLIPAAQAQRSRSFPLVAVHSAGPGATVYEADPMAIVALEDAWQVRLDGVTTPRGDVLALELERIRLDSRRFGFHVDGRARPELLEGAALTLWRGRVQGDPNSDVLLSFSLHGSFGWIQHVGERWHVVTLAGAPGAILLTDARDFASASQLPRFECAADSAGAASRISLPSNLSPTDGPPPGGVCTLRECKIAVETDYQLFERFGDLGAMAAYTVTLFGAVSERYERSAETVLTFPYIGFYTDPNDPWHSMDDGGTAGELHNEFRIAWNGAALPGGARLAHFFSGAPSPATGAAGVAGVDALCSTTNNFGVSLGISGYSTFPVPFNPTFWDFYVVAHELGHNFGALHTHQYCPPIDECASLLQYGPCQTQRVCSVSTLMSYCIQCDGGWANIQNEFHPQIAAIMRGRAQACLPLYEGWITASAAVMAEAGEAVEVRAIVSTQPTTSVELVTRIDGGPWMVSALAFEGAFTWTGFLPVLECDEELEWYVRYTEPDCGVRTDPVDAPATTYTIDIGTPATVFEDDFEFDSGWTTENLGAASGDWERGVPVDDPVWAFDPPSDADGSGRAWLTENAIGATGVRSGSVRLVSPAFDLADGPARVRYSYWLRLQHQNGSDHIRVEASDQGLAGPWVTIATHPWNGPVWREHEISPQEFQAAGLVPSADTRIRFTATEASPTTSMEAGIDAFSIAVVTCIESQAVVYCDPPSGNSISPSGAQLSHVAGELGDTLTLRIHGVPTQPALLFHGSQSTDTPFGCGRRCVGGSVVRALVHQPTSHDQLLHLDTTGLAGTSPKLQLWYRDPAHQPTCGSAFNLSNALSF